MSDETAGMFAMISELIDDRADAWDCEGKLPDQLLRELGGKGLLCTQVPSHYGGLGLSSRQSGEYAAHVGSLCSSVRSVMTSQGMAAEAIQRLGGADQRAAYLSRLTSGELAAVAFSEPGAGSDLSAMSTRIHTDGDSVVVVGQKVWVTAAQYADLLVVFGRHDDGAAAVVIPAAAPGVVIERIDNPLGCRAAGHANVRLDSVRLAADSVLGGTGMLLSLLLTSALSYGRMSVAWGCVGILRACLSAATRHAGSRVQFGKPLAEHQLVARHLAELYVSEQVATRACEHASQHWDARSPDAVMAALLAKHVSAGQAARGAASAVQVMSSAGVLDGHVAARAYRDAKLMEIIEGSNEICQLMLAEHALTLSR